MVAAEGIAPSSRTFQDRANLSQLNSHIGCRIYNTMIVIWYQSRTISSSYPAIWLRELDLNQRSKAYGASQLANYLHPAIILKAGSEI